MVCSSLGKIFFLSFMTYWGTDVDSTHEEVLSTLGGNFFFATLEEVAFVPWTHGGVLP